MTRLIVTACTFAILIGAGGCTGGDAEGEMQKYINQLNALADAYEKNDEEKAKAAVADLKETEKKLKEIKVTESQKKKLDEKFKEDLTKALTRVFTAQIKSPDLTKKINYSPAKD